MKRTKCSICNRTVPAGNFFRNMSHCKNCHRKMFRVNRNRFIPKELLTDADMERELKNYKPPPACGLNALLEFEKQFKDACRIKTFKSRKTRKKAFMAYYDQEFNKFYKLNS